MENQPLWLQIFIVLGIFGIIAGMIYGLVKALIEGPPSKKIN